MLSAAVVIRAARVKCYLKPINFTIVPLIDLTTENIECLLSNFLYKFWKEEKCNTWTAKIRHTIIALSALRIGLGGEVTSVKGLYVVSSYGISPL